MPERWRIWTHARLLTLADDRSAPGIVEDGAIAAHEGRIVYAGALAGLARDRLADAQIIDCAGRWITPGLIDCHTHLIHAGHRAREFEMRLAGARYEEIARAGGGIMATVGQVRATTQADLVRESLPRLETLMAEGVTTIEVKSGYGLTLEDELKMLRAARTLADRRPVTVRSTYLGAHAIPPDYQGRSRAFIDQVVIPALQAAHAEGLIDAVDGFCEGIAFSPAEIEVVFDAARALGLPVKLHADQLSNLQGAQLAARHGALSADHLEHTDEAGVARMAAAGTVAVLLPGAYYYLRDTRPPPVDLFRQHGVAMAIATDCNPGTSPLTSLLLAMNMGATVFGLTVEECLAGVTREAARALGLLDRIGTLTVGKQADLAIWNIEQPAELVYRIGFNPLHQRVWAGVPDPIGIRKGRSA